MISRQIASARRALFGEIATTRSTNANSERGDDGIGLARTSHSSSGDLGSAASLNPVQPPSQEANDPTRSSYGPEYWLRRCQGFLVETPTKRIGRVAGIRYGEDTNEPEVLEVRAGLFGRTVLLISVHDIAQILPEKRLLVLTDAPRPLPG